MTLQAQNDLSPQVCVEPCKGLPRIYPSATILAVPSERGKVVFDLEKLAEAMKVARILSWRRLGRLSRLPSNTIARVKTAQPITEETASKVARALHTAFEDLTVSVFDRGPGIGVAHAPDAVKEAFGPMTNDEIALVSDFRELGIKQQQWIRDSAHQLRMGREPKTEVDASAPKRRKQQ